MAKGQYDAKALAWLDWVFAQAQSHGLNVILDIWSTPCWASSAPVTMTLGCTYGWWSRPVRYYPPKNAQDYADFAAFAAKRWAPELAAVELWNEPNGNFFYSQDKAGDYARLVRVTEVGWSSATVGLRAQADDVTSVLRQLAALPYVSATELYELRDEAFNPLGPADNFGLIFDNFYPKPAWYAFVSSLASSEGT